KRTIKQLHADLMSLGYEGSYGRVAAFARAWKEERQRQMQTSGRGTFVPLAFEPGEAFQFDWSEDWAVLGGERTAAATAMTMPWRRASSISSSANGYGAGPTEHARRQGRTCST